MEFRGVMITTTEIRQRKTILPATPNVVIAEEEEEEEVEEQHVKTVQMSTQKQNNSQGWFSDKAIARALFLLSLPVRFHNLPFPAQVVFDELHFGKFVSYYIKHDFFFDVHPPLAKLLITFVAWISGFKGDFDFTEIGKPIPDDVPYIQMRALGTLAGSFVVPLGYLTIRDAGHSRIAAILTALAICFENGLITNNRLILLDSYHVLLTAFTIFAWTRFYNKTRPFDRSWWKWLFLTGVGLGCTASTKWVGLFTIATVGLSTLKNIWNILGDIQVTKRRFALHFFARAVCLIVVPAIIYIGSFYIHLSLLTRTGPGMSYMELGTQNELKGFDPIDTPVRKFASRGHESHSSQADNVVNLSTAIVYGSLITMRHLYTTGGYLHSHKANYADGSQQQQITIYPHRDLNNWWRVLKADIFQDPKNDLLARDNETWLEYVRDGDLIRLEHVETAPRKLHSHDFPAPVTDTDYHKEVSGYGFPNHVGDSNDYWRVKIDDNEEYNDASYHLQSRRSKFRLHHTNQDCHLFGSFNRLPDWGHGQQEVSCIQEGLKPKTMWMVEETENEMLPENVEIMPEHRPDFWEKFTRLNRLMWLVNSGLTEDHPFESRPHEWPLLLSGIVYWNNETTQILLLGNPLVYWASTVAVLTFLFMYGLFQLRDKRGCRNSFGGFRAFYEASAGFFVVGWSLHYVPFILMKRQLFSHHYMPALYFAVLTLGVGIDLILRRFYRALRVFFFLTAAGCIVYTYWVYSPLAYGEKWTMAECENATLLKSWSLNCARYAPLGSPVRFTLGGEEEIGIAATATTNTVPEPDEIIYVDEQGNRLALEDVPQEYLDSPDYVEKEEAAKEEERPVTTATQTTEVEPDEIVYVDEDGNILALEDVPPEYLDNPDYIMEVEEDEEDEEYEFEIPPAPSSTVDAPVENMYEGSDDEEEDELYDVPTEAPEPPEYEPEFIDGKEVFGEEEDEEDWPKTIYGIDPEADEDDSNPPPLTVRDIPLTKHVNF